jgi:hypothetical protein
MSFNAPNTIPRLPFNKSLPMFIMLRVLLSNSLVSKKFAYPNRISAQRYEKCAVNKNKLVHQPSTNFTTR